MRNALSAAAAVLALPLFAFGCTVDTTVEDDVQEAAEETEVVATTEQAITASQREGIGKIYDTGASLGFAEFFASLVNWSAQPAPSLQVDVDQMKASINSAIVTRGSSGPPRTGTFQAISSPSVTERLI